MGVLEDAIAERERRALVAAAVAEKERRTGDVVEPPGPISPGGTPRDIRIPKQHALSTAEEVKLAIKETPQNLKIGTIGLTASVFEAIKRRGVQLAGGGILDDETVLSQFEAVSPTAKVGRSQLLEAGEKPLPETEEELFERVNLFKTGRIRLPGAIAAQAAGVVTKLPDIAARALREKQRRESMEQDSLTMQDAPLVTLNRLVVQSGVPSMAAAVGISLLTGDPLVGLVMLGESEGGAAFQSQLESGGSVRKALIIAELSEAAEIGGEMLVLPKIVGGLKKGLSIRRGLTLVAENSFQEGVTGFNQQFLQVFGEETTKGTDKVLAAKIAFVAGVKAIPENAFVGGVVAGGTGTASVVIKQVARAVESDIATEGPAAEVSATLAGLQAQSEAEAKLAAGTPLSEAERTQFPQIAEQESQIAKLAETPPPEEAEIVPDQPQIEKEAVVVQPEGVEEAKAVEVAEKPVSKAQQRNIDALKKFPQADVVKGTTRVRMESPKGTVFQIPATQIQGKLDAGFTLLTKPKKPVTVTKPPKKVEPKPVTAEVKQTQSKAVQGEPVTQQTVKEVEDAIKVDVTDPAFPTSTKHASTKEIRDRLGIGQVNSKTRRSDEQAMAEAVERKIPEKALRIADDINTTARALSDIEDAGMRIKVAELEIEHEQLMKLIGDSKDEADTKTLSTDAARVEAEFDSIISALETSGTEAGRALRARKVQIGRDFKLVSVLNRAKAAAGKKLSAVQSRLFKQLTEKLSKRVKQIDALRIEVAILKAGQTVKRGARRFTTMNKQQRQTSRQGLSAKVVELLQQGCAN